MEDFQSKYTGEQVEEYLDQIANGEVGGGDGGASVYTWEWDGNEQGSVTDEVFTSIYNSDVLYLRYAGMDIPATVARADLTLIIAASILGGDSLLTIGVTFTWLNYTAEMTTKEIGGGDSLWYEDSEGRASCDRDIYSEGNISAGSAFIIGSIGVPEPEGGYNTGDKGQILVADGNGMVAWDDLSIPTNISQLNDDRGLVDQQFVRENFIEGSEDSLGMKVALIDQFMTPYGSLLYAFPDTANGDEDDVILTRGTVKTINGETIYGSGDITIQGGGAVDNVYITDFTVNDLDVLIADSDKDIQASIDELQNAITAHKVVLVPYDANERFYGYGVATGYLEDYLYVTIILDNGRFIDLELPLNSAGIRGQEVRERVWHGKQDALVSGTNIKTINGTSLLGSGNIVISGGGGSSSGRGAYAEVNHGTSDTTFTLTPNTFHVWDEVSALTLTFGSETAGVANEFLFQFTSGATATSLTLPDDIKWANDAPPTIAENMIYQVSILKGLASVLEFNNAVVSSIFPATLTVGDNGDLGVSVYETLYEGVALQEGDLTLIIDGKNYFITEYEPDYDYSNGGLLLLYLEDGPIVLYYILESSGEVNLYMQ